MIVGNNSVGKSDAWQLRTRALGAHGPRPGPPCTDKPNFAHALASAEVLRARGFGLGCGSGASRATRSHGEVMLMLVAGDAVGRCYSYKLLAVDAAATAAPTGTMLFVRRAGR